MTEQISYAKKFYGKEEIDAEVDCLNKSTQMGQISRDFERHHESTSTEQFFKKENFIYIC